MGRPARNLTAKGIWRMGKPRARGRQALRFMSEGAFPGRHQRQRTNETAAGPVTLCGVGYAERGEGCCKCRPASRADFASHSRSKNDNSPALCRPLSCSCIRTRARLRMPPEEQPVLLVAGPRAAEARWVKPPSVREVKEQTWVGTVVLALGASLTHLGRTGLRRTPPSSAEGRR